MVTIAYMLYWLGVAIFLIGNLMFLAVAFRFSAIWFLGCLLVPFVDVLYFCLNVRQTWKPFLLTITGFLMSGIGYWLGGFNFERGWLQCSSPYRFHIFLFCKDLKNDAFNHEM